MVVPAYVYLDDATQRIVASTKIDKFLDNCYPSFKLGQKVAALVYKHTEQGYKLIVENKFSGLVYESSLYAPLVIGDKITAYIKRLRPDGKIDLILSGSNDGRVETLMQTILQALRREPESFLPINDNSSPEAIRASFHCSKKDFKKAIGGLYRMRKIILADDGIRLLD